MSCAVAVRPAVKVTICQPHAAAGAHFETYRAQRRAKLQPVHAPDRADDGGNYSSGLSYDDYSRMQTISRVVGHKHRREIPFWTMNDDATRRVTLHYMEGRCWSKKKRSAIIGTERERFIRVIAALRVSALHLTASVDKLCGEYVEHYACTAPFCIARRAVLASLISGLDKQLVLANHPDIFYNIVTAYYRQRMNSHEVAEYVGWVTPDGVRQTIRRMNIIAKRLGYTVEFIKKSTPEQLAERKAQRARALAGRIEMNLQRLAKKLEKQCYAEEQRKAEIADVPRVKQTGGRKSGWRKYGDGLTTRERWKRDGKCVQCGGKHGPKREMQKTCAFCGEKFAARTAARLAAAKAERALHPVPKEVWKANLSAARKALWRKKKGATEAAPIVCL